MIKLQAWPRETGKPLPEPATESTPEPPEPSRNPHLKHDKSTGSGELEAMHSGDGVMGEEEKKYISIIQYIQQYFSAYK